MPPIQQAIDVHSCALVWHNHDDDLSNSLHPAEAAGVPLRRLTMHHTVIAACSKTAGHRAMPVDCDRTPTAPRMSATPRLYTTMAATSARAARLSASPSASQEAVPSVSNATPPTCATAKASTASNGARAGFPPLSRGNSEALNPLPPQSRRSRSAEGTLTLSC
jgi:hypothetical protein